MTLDLKSELLENLKKVKGPNLESNIVDLGLVSEIQLIDNKATFSISVPVEKAETLEPLRAAAEKVAKSITGIDTAFVILTSEKEGKGGEVNQASVRPAPSSSEMGSVPPPMANAGGMASADGAPGQQVGLPQGIKSIVAISSGKGGVGKSTTSVNIALALQARGMKVGILDADIYGPSLPRLLGISGRPTQVSGRIIKPLDGFGIKVISMGFLVDEETPMIWRGPMVISAITQMLREVQWGEIDMLIVDMPPGTGDVQLTLAQQVPLAGAVIVSTPQDLALIDARKGLNMFRQVEVPVLGIIENMSYFICPHCGDSHGIFGHGGAKEEAERIGVPFLGGVPLHQDIRTNSDAGTPIIISDPEGEHAKTYNQITKNILERIKQEEEMINRPNIVIE
ncbi:MAG: iron-sulfur cluster carrier protein [Methyloligella sp.]|nr:MAG: iron-sulfur cluster carrier protein [Methyloligella sp.]